MRLLWLSAALAAAFAAAPLFGPWRGRMGVRGGPRAWADRLLERMGRRRADQRLHRLGRRADAGPLRRDRKGGETVRHLGSRDAHRCGEGGGTRQGRLDRPDLADTLPHHRLVLYLARSRHDGHAVVVGMDAFFERES